MSPDEREHWWDRLAALTWETREPAIYALLDRVEDLERQLAEVRDAPPHPSWMVMGQDGDVQAYQSIDDRPRASTVEPGGWGYSVRSWNWHPAKSAKEDT